MFVICSAKITLRIINKTTSSVWNVRVQYLFYIKWPSLLSQTRNNGPRAKRSSGKIFQDIGPKHSQIPGLNFQKLNLVKFWVLKVSHFRTFYVYLKYSSHKAIISVTQQNIAHTAGAEGADFFLKTSCEIADSHCIILLPHGNIGPKHPLCNIAHKGPTP